MDSVAAARVHLAMPNQNGFFREQEKASASVVLTLHPGRTLDRAQLAGIVHLVSRSVPDLKPADVSVIDNTGALLNPQDNASGLDSVQLEYRKQIESGSVKRVLELLEPVVGRDNLRATVTADIDFSQVESTAEEYKPNQGDAPATIRALRTEESTQPGATVPSGVPGAQSNQPQATPAAPITGAAAPLQAAQAGVTGGNGRRESETRFEVDKMVRVTRGATGNVKRLNAAVVDQPPQHHRRQGQDHHRPAEPGRDRKAHRPGAAGHRLQRRARRPGQGHQRALPRRAGAAGGSGAAVAAALGAGPAALRRHARRPGAGGPDRTVRLRAARR